MPASGFSTTCRRCCSAAVRAVGRALALYVLGLVAVVIPAGAVERLTVISMDPVANYGLTRDSNDARQLVDGIEHPFPAWTRKASVAWRDASFVAIELRQAPDSGTDCRHSRMRLAFGHSPRAGVLAARRVDVYAVRGDRLHHATSWQGLPEPGFVGVEHAHLEFDSTWDELVVAIHPAGRFLMLDEIEVDAVGACSAPVGQAPGIHRESLRENSTARLMKAFESAPTGDQRARPEHLVVLDRRPYAARLESADSRRRVALEGESLDFMLQVDGPCSKSGYRVQAHATSDNRVELFEVGRVRTFTGALRYDPLQPLDKDQRLPCSPVSPSLLWVTVTPPEGTSTAHGLAVEIAAHGRDAIRLDYEFEVIERPAGHCRPRVVSWGYTGQKPIWAHPAKTFAEMARSGANVHVIAPSSLPPLEPGKLPRGIDLISLVGEIKRAKRAFGEVEILLFAAFHRASERSRTSIGNDYFVAWTRALADGLTRLGIQPHEWLLYPVDEPRADMVDALVELAEVLKSSVPGLRLYANPINTGSARLSSNQLRAMRRSFDVLQPNAALARSHVGELTEGTWWVYMNARWPAKDEPPGFYRGLGTLAVLLGTSGYGTWSLSDTRGSSAWNDFDGTRPDWAMLYEASGAPIPSRRWRGFVKAAGDFAALCRARTEKAAWWRTHVPELPTKITRGDVARLSTFAEAARAALAGKGG